MRTINIWNLSTVIITLVIFAVLTSNILLIPWSYFTKEKNTLEWITLIFGTGSLIWSFLLFKLHFYRQNKKISKKLKYTKEYDFNQNEDTEKVIQLLKEKDIYNKNIEYRIDGSNNLKDDPQRAITNSPIALNYQEKNIILIPGFFLARFRNHPKTFASVLTHETAHFNNKDITIIYKVRVFLKSIITIFTLSIILWMATSIYADIQMDSNQYYYAIQASIVGKNYLIFQGLIIFVLALIHKELEIWREALADNEAIKHFGEEEIIKSEKLLNLKQQFIRATSFHLKNVQILSPIWIFIAGIIIAIFSSRLAGTLNHLFIISNNTHLFDIADTISNILLYSGFFYILTTFLKNLKNKNSQFIQLILISSLLLIVGDYTAFLLLEVLPHIISSTLMPEGYDYILRYNPIATIISSTQIFFETSSIILLVLVSLLLGHSQQKIYLGFLFGFSFFIAILIERFYFPHILDGWLSISIFVPLFILLYKNNYQYRINKKSYLLGFLILLFSSLDYFGFTNINHFSKIEMALGNQELAKQNIEEAIDHYHKTLKISPNNLDITIHLIQLLAHNNQLDDALKISKNAEFTIKYYEPSWNKLYKYHTIVGSLRLQRNQLKDLEKAKEHYHEAEYMYRNNSRLESSLSQILFYNLVCLNAKTNDYINATVYLLEYLSYFKDLEIIKDTDLTLFVNYIKKSTPLSKERLLYLEKTFQTTTYKYTAVETIKLLENRQITLEDILYILKIKTLQ